MASIYSGIACPHCGCCATEDDYYKTGEKFIWCFRCGYSFYRTIDYFDGNNPVYNETEHEGYGMVFVVSKDEETDDDGRTILNRPLSDKEMDEFKQLFLKENVDLKKSYFVTYENGEFTTIAGTPPEDFYIAFEDYKAKMGEGNLELIVPVPSLGN
ncbi:hypothetical protein EU245_06555 [Lentibacillus lipolyticus]|nr:hypothetical protein EU245_06555 [Lentibacillus lipolyticus]